MKYIFTSIFILLSFISSYGQKQEYTVATIPDSLKINANAVVRLNQIDIDISSQSNMKIKTKRVVTILNDKGLSEINAVENYDKVTSVKNIDATVYNAFGKEIKNLKRKDFKDQAAVDGETMFSDSRVIYLNYTPTEYPFTIVYESETATSNTAFIPYWSPIEGYLASTEKTLLTVNFKPELHLKKKEVNFSGKYPIEKEETPTSVTYTARNLVAKKREELAPKADMLFPKIMFGLESFNLEGLDGNANSWKEMGKWFYDEILSGTTELPEETKNKIKGLVGNETDPLKKAEIVYKYVQAKTRYVSIQEGIGGWKPMLAKDVDKLGYGDCKALTNYTRSLLNEVGVLSYYSRLYGGSERKEIVTDIVSFQSNHVILAIPDKSDYVWLECTSQIHPFGFQGNFTDDRNVLIVKPEGGEIVRTKTFTEIDNLKTTKGSYAITGNGDLDGKVKIVSKGLEYDREFGKERLGKEDQVKTYKEEFSNINNLSVHKITLHNDSNTIEFTQDLEFKAEGYAQNSNGKLMFALNAFDQNAYVPQKYKTREFSFEIQRGYTNESETEITIPNGFSVEAKPAGTELNTEFGNYKIEFSITGPNTLLCKRKLVIRKGLFDKANYENYRKFREAIAKNDNSKIVIAKK